MKTDYHDENKKVSNSREFVENLLEHCVTLVENSQPQKWQLVDPATKQAFSKYIAELEEIILNLPSHKLAANACYVLGLLKNTASAEALCNALRFDENVLTCATAAYALGEIGVVNERVITALVLAFLRDPDLVVRVAAANTLAKIEHPFISLSITGILGTNTDGMTLARYTNTFQPLLAALADCDQATHDWLIQLLTAVHPGNRLPS